MYRPGFIKYIFLLFIFLNSCSPANYISTKNDKADKELDNNKTISNEQEITKNEEENKIILQSEESKINDITMQKEVSIILPMDSNSEITNQFLNVIQLAISKKKLKNISFDVNLYNNANDLLNIIDNKTNPGRIFLGPLSSEHTKLLSNYCNKGVIFFSFASNTDLAKNCVYLINFFPKNELETLFNYFPEESKIAILYPQNDYGYSVNVLVDEIAIQSNSVIINRASYKTDLSNVREAIKELGKYELRKYELNRQKQILAKKKDDKSKKRLKKLEKFQTTKDFDFTHILLPDYGIRLLQVAPLLPYYDVDPNIVQFVGTGVWDDPIFFSEPSLQKSIFPGVEISKRSQLIKQYQNIYENKLMRTSTLAYDLIGLIFYVYEQKMDLNDLYNLLEDSNIKFDGIDGRFYFENNIIRRDLSILQILNGKATKIN